MTIPFHTCDVFTDTPFSGNPLAVIPDATMIPENRLQAIAREFNFSETVFVYPPVDPLHTRRVRIFTPGGELPFAGHPTIGTAVTLVLTGEIPVAAGECRMILEEGIGPVPVFVRSVKERSAFAQLSAAQLPSFDTSVPPIDSLQSLLGLPPEEFAVDRFPVQFVSVGYPFLFIALRNRRALERIRVNVTTMEELRLKEMFVFTDDPERKDFHFRARMFAPLLGIAEDPATGSAAAAFAGYLAALDARRDGEWKWSVEQGVEMGRPSQLYIEAEKKENEITAVRVGGRAVMITSGLLTLSSG